MFSIDSHFSSFFQRHQSLSRKLRRGALTKEIWITLPHLVDVKLEEAPSMRLLVQEARFGELGLEGIRQLSWDRESESLRTKVFEEGVMYDVLVSGGLDLKDLYDFGSKIIQMAHVPKLHCHSAHSFLSEYSKRRIGSPIIVRLHTSFDPQDLLTRWRMI